MVTVGNIKNISTRFVGQKTMSRVLLIKEDVRKIRIMVEKEKKARICFSHEKLRLFSSSVKSNLRIYVFQ